jgi:hypothetical protein
MRGGETSKGFTKIAHHPPSRQAQGAEVRVERLQSETLAEEELPSNKRANRDGG